MKTQLVTVGDTKPGGMNCAELRGLDLTALKQRWRVFYRTEAPVHIGRALLLQGSCLSAAGKSSWRP